MKFTIKQENNQPTCLFDLYPSALVTARVRGTMFFSCLSVHPVLVIMISKEYLEGIIFYCSHELNDELSLCSKVKVTVLCSSTFSCNCDVSGTHLLQVLFSSLLYLSDIAVEGISFHLGQTSTWKLNELKKESESGLLRFK